MEGDFYRPAPARHRVKDGLKRLVKNRRRLVVIVLGFILLMYLLFDNKGILARIGLEMKQSEMEQKVEEAEAETKQLQQRLKGLQGDKQTIEKTAREKHGMAREGETVYRIKPQE
ncbi:MAG: septum formation initiator family protein [Ignavibacteria bacterium]|nr:septum formation initiator family protein [Ignavibacteria bacterium]